MPVRSSLLLAAILAFASSPLRRRRHRPSPSSPSPGSASTPTSARLDHHRPSTTRSGCCFSDGGAEHDGLRSTARRRRGPARHGRRRRPTSARRSSARIVAARAPAAGRPRPSQRDGRGGLSTTPGSVELEGYDCVGRLARRRRPAPAPDDGPHGRSLFTLVRARASPRSASRDASTPATASACRPDRPRRDRRRAWTAEVALRRRRVAAMVGTPQARSPRPSPRTARRSPSRTVTFTRPRRARTPGSTLTGRDGQGRRSRTRRLHGAAEGTDVVEASFIASDRASRARSNAGQRHVDRAAAAAAAAGRGRGAQGHRRRRAPGRVATTAPRSPTPTRRTATATRSATRATSCRPATRPVVAGETAQVTAVSGEVFIKLPKGTKVARGDYARAAQKAPIAGFVPIKGVATVPIGSEIDSRKGQLDLKTASKYDVQGPADGPAAGPLRRRACSRSARPRGRRAKSRQRQAGHRPRAADAARAVARVRGRQRACGRSRASCARWRRPAKGAFRTIGAASTITATAGTWIVSDRCDGTMTEVGRGKVVVRDTQLEEERHACARARATWPRRSLFAARQKGKS